MRLSVCVYVNVAQPVGAVSYRSSFSPCLQWLKATHPDSNSAADTEGLLKRIRVKARSIHVCFGRCNRIAVKEGGARGLCVRACVCASLSLCLSLSLSLSVCLSVCLSLSLSLSVSLHQVDKPRRGAVGVVLISTQVQELLHVVRKRVKINLDVLVALEREKVRLANVGTEQEERVLVVCQPDPQHIPVQGLRRNLQLHQHVLHAIRRGPGHPDWHQG